MVFFVDQLVYLAHFGFSKILLIFKKNYYSQITYVLFQVFYIFYNHFIRVSSMKIQNSCTLTNLMLNFLGCPTRPAKKSRLDSDACSSSCCADCDCDSDCCTTSEEHDKVNSVSSIIDNSDVPLTSIPDDAQTNQTVTKVVTDSGKYRDPKPSVKLNKPSGLFQQLSVLMRGSRKNRIK